MQCRSREFAAGLPDFSWSKLAKKGNAYQIIANCTKRPENTPSGRKIFQIVIKYEYQHFPFHGLQLIGIFGTK
jgi:hypothetical protein